MTLYDSSVLIDYLDGDQEVVAYAENNADEEAKAVHLALYEVYLGELYTEGDPNFDAVEDALSWITAVSYQSTKSSRRAAELMARLQTTGHSLAFRDGYIATAAWEMQEPLVTRDADFDIPALREEIDVEVI